MPRQPAPTTAKRVRDALSKGGLRSLESTRVFHRGCMIVALDCLNSALNPGTIVAFGAETMPLGRFERYVVPKYKTFFARASSAFQKCIYFRSPYADFWGNFMCPHMYDEMVEQISALAKQLSLIHI